MPFSLLLSSCHSRGIQEDPQNSDCRKSGRDRGRRLEQPPWLPKPLEGLARVRCRVRQGGPEQRWVLGTTSPRLKGYNRDGGLMWSLVCRDVDGWLCTGCSRNLDEYDRTFGAPASRELLSFGVLFPPSLRSKCLWAIKATGAYFHIGCRLQGPSLPDPRRLPRRLTELAVSRLVVLLIERMQTRSPRDKLLTVFHPTYYLFREASCPVRRLGAHDRRRLPAWMGTPDRHRARSCR
jgi:hypothetical protein